MKEGYKIVIFGNSIFNQSKELVREAEFEIQKYGIDFMECNHCKMEEVIERYSIEREFIVHNTALPIDLIQLTSFSKGTRMIFDEEDRYSNSVYKGWKPSLCANLYIPIKTQYLTIQDVMKIKVIGVRHDVNIKNMKNPICSIYAGADGFWNFYINMHFDKDNNIEYNSFTHPSCAEDIFRETDAIQNDNSTGQFPETEETAEQRFRESVDQHNDLSTGETTE